MKKNILIIIFLFLLLITSCSVVQIGRPQNEDGTSQSVNTSEIISAPQYPENQIFRLNTCSGTAFNGLEESDILQISNLVYEYDRKDAPQNFEFEFNGEIYDLGYKQTTRYLYHNDDIDTYSFNSDVTEISVDINVSTGKIEDFFVHDEIYELSKEDGNAVELSNDDCFEIAKNYISQYADGLHEYKLIKQSEYDDHSSIFEGKGYYFQFAYFINNVITPDIIEIAVTSFGDVVCYSSFDPGHMKDAVLPSTNDMEQLEAKLFDFIKSVYDGYVYEYQDNLEKTQFVRLYNGQYAIVYEVLHKERDLPEYPLVSTLEKYIIFVG